MTTWILILTLYGSSTSIHSLEVANATTCLIAAKMWHESIKYGERSAICIPKIIDQTRSQEQQKFSQN